jgi:predicted AlkP superfamily pyrophosphatase or phosphodiesterase
MPVVFFLLDAMRHDYITERNTPFLWRCGQECKYYKRVIPNFGFCERTEILTGLTPEESGFFTAIGFDPENSPFKGIKLLLLLDVFERFIPKKLRVPGRDTPGCFYRYYRGAVSKLLRKFSNSGMSTYCIPFLLLPHFSLTEDQIDHRCKDAFPTQSVLQLLENRGQSYFYHSFTALNLPPNGSDNDRMDLALRAAGKKDYALYLIYISLPDSYGHKYGPESSELRTALHDMDARLERFTGDFKKKVGKCKFIFLGDHGMIPVTRHFDAGRVIFDISKKLGLKIKKDFIYFLDSTLVRLWFFTDRAKRLFSVALKESEKFNKHGIFIDEHIAQKYHIPWGDRRYGDMTWWADTGVLVYPDFFHNDGVPYKGMHGYMPELSESQGTCIVYGHCTNKMEIDSIRLTFSFNILKEALKTCTGK